MPRENVAAMSADISKKIAESRRSRFPRVYLDEASVDLQANYLLKGLIQQGSNGMIYGPSGSGKTFLAIDFASHIAAGISWRGKRVKQGTVVYVAAEAGTSILRRFVAWRERKLGDAREGRIPLVILTRAVNLLDEVEVAELIAELESIVEEIGQPIGLVIFDTVSRSIPGGDENSAMDMTRVVRVADRIRDELRAATLCVHHSGKDPQKGARGHSALFAAADTVIHVDDRVATVEKVRDGVAGEQFPFGLDVVELGTDSDGDPVTTCVVRHLDDAQRERSKPKLSDSEKIALEAIKDAVADSGVELPETSSLPRKRGVKVEQWRENFYRRSGEEVDRKDGAAVKAFQRARTSLIAKNIVGASAPWAWLW